MLEMSLVGATALRIPALGLGEPTAKPSLRGRDRLLRAGHMGHVLRAASGVPSGRLPRLSGPGWAAKQGASTSGGQVAGLLSGGKGIRGARSGAEALPAELEPMEARERALRRVARAAHHFAALGLTAAEAMTATPAVVQKAWGGMVAM